VIGIANAVEYWQVCKKEYEILVSLNAQEIVEQRSGMSVLSRRPVAFTYKRFPYRDVEMKLKHQFYAQGYYQIIGVNFFETKAPVVNWQIICTSSFCKEPTIVTFDQTSQLHSNRVVKYWYWIRPGLGLNVQEGTRIEWHHYTNAKRLSNPGTHFKSEEVAAWLRTIKSPRNFFLLHYTRDELEEVGFE
jgi:hypothetical protein